MLLPLARGQGRKLGRYPSRVRYLDNEAGVVLISQLHYYRILRALHVKKRGLIVKEAIQVKDTGLDEARHVGARRL